MTIFDEIAEKTSDDQWEEWRMLVFSAKDEITAFVSTYRRAAKAKYVNWYQGSFNFCLRISFDTGPDAIIRFSGPGHTTFRDEKVQKEVEIIKFLHEKTTIPIPRLIGWGLTIDSPRGLGPYIISEFAEGVSLCDVLSDPDDQKKVYLNPKIDMETLDTVFEQIAGFMLQLYQFDFPSIGSISKDSSNSWLVTGRPLTYTMNELATTAFYPVDKFATTPFKSSREYFEGLMREHMTHLWTQRNLAFNQKQAEERYVARHLFAKLVDKFCVNNGSYKLFCDDFRPQNMLVDPKTLRITAVLDLEFTNALPSQFASESPWWLLLVGPDMFLYRGHTMEEFVAQYEPRLEQFLQAMRRVEKANPLLHGERPLSDLMYESWYSKRFWFNFAARKPFDVEVFFKTRLNDSGADVHSLDTEAHAGLDKFIDVKMKQLRGYLDDCEKIL
ncbi:MAG: hypothetical protein M1820_002598 [Bogoriella megaspora]|nr:MAG: hypothetical protein M1820_002598 [Bogoriella megaspora]